MHTTQSDMKSQVRIRTSQRGTKRRRISIDMPAQVDTTKMLDSISNQL